MGIEYEANAQLTPTQSHAFLARLAKHAGWKLARKSELGLAFAYADLPGGDWGEHFAVAVRPDGRVYVVFHGVAGERDAATLLALKGALRDLGVNDVDFEDL